MKKTWESPKLIALVRAQQSETVLTYCKESGETGAQNAFSGCYEAPDAAVLVLCQYCSDLQAS